MANSQAKRRDKRPSLLKRIGTSDQVTRLAGRTAAAYLRFVRRTSTLEFEPSDPYEFFGHLLPGIVAMWHGQHLMVPFIRREGHDVRVMISKHRDGEINAIAAESLGLGTVRASAARSANRVIEKGGLRGFLEMKAALAQGATVAMTADLSNQKSRRAGPGIVMLARASGRPIVPVAVATSRHFVVKNWDRTTVNLPFSKGICVFGGPIYVPADADDTVIEQKRLELENELNRVTERAYQRVGRSHV
ncbi:lysophospholipid acyltransferase family protein [Kaistia nematophila]|uniref:Lysophospholipid acyltransferase family protein n=1 Tax=Kaistia nematophila TaxID=2994654 RepID=A0A9X3E345_9HYPH|nr:lysophospholipid acyltransferase family protein [Kaistia nematophila]MCX5570795.1 lysophospholipid acyltransferase family protein [Kaistia nematophila]